MVSGAAAAPARLAIRRGVFAELCRQGALVCARRKESNAPSITLICLWHLADIDAASENVRFRG